MSRLLHFSQDNHKGNALFLILIAVALFAALSYAVTQSGRGSGSIGKEQAQLLAAQVVSVAAAVQQGIQRLVLTGMTADTIVTNDPLNKCCSGSGTANGYANFCMTGSDCLFAPEGGGLAPPVLPAAAFETGMTGYFGITHAFDGPNAHNGIQFDGLHPGAAPPFTAVSGIGTAANDDLLEIYPLKKDVCLAINRGLGISGIPDHNNTNPIAVTAGKEAACIDWFGDDTLYMYYHVLVAL